MAEHEAIDGAAASSVVPGGLWPSAVIDRLATSHIIVLNFALIGEVSRLTWAHETSAIVAERGASRLSCMTGRPLSGP